MSAMGYDLGPVHARLRLRIPNGRGPTRFKKARAVDGNACLPHGPNVFPPPQTLFRSVPDRLASSSLSAALNPRAVPSVSRNFTVNASYCLGVTCTSSGASAASDPLRFSFGDTPNASLRSVCCGPPAASDARRFPEPEGDGLGGIAAARWHSDDAGR